MRHLAALLAGALALVGNAVAAPRQPSFTITTLEAPVSAGAQAPMLSAMPDGRVLMSWIEPAKQGFAMRIATRDADGWTKPRTVVEADDLFVNWADFPSAVALPDGTLVAHWLRENGDSSYAYDVNIAISDDDGHSWPRTLVPHDDGTRQQHGFVTLLPLSRDRLMTIWLDGRAYDADAAIPDLMQLRAATLSSIGALSGETLLDVNTCSCCQTAATVTGSGTVLVAYRDRTEDEIRDISILRRVDGVWADPKTVHADEWRIAGCPVNGPAIDSAGNRAAVAWFTGAGDVPKVKVAFSDDDGETFGDPITLNKDWTTGRVDVLQRDDHSALVSWVEQTDFGEVLYICAVKDEEGCDTPQAVTLNRGDQSIGFPRMARGRDGVHIAWTAPLAGGAAVGGRDSTIRVALIKMAGAE